MKSDFKRTINCFKIALDWNKCQLKVTMQAPNPYSDYLTDPSFQGANRFFV